MSKYIKCPRCRCTDLIVLEDNRDNIGRGAFGYALTGSLLGGIAFANMKKSVYQCGNCGKVFKAD